MFAHFPRPPDLGLSVSGCAGKCKQLMPINVEHVDLDLSKVQSSTGLKLSLHSRQLGNLDDIVLISSRILNDLTRHDLETPVTIRLSTRISKVEVLSRCTMLWIRGHHLMSTDMVGRVIHFTSGRDFDEVH
jgi:hypothetical protein